MQYAPENVSFGIPIDVTSCVQTNESAQLQYDAPSSVRPAAFAQRQEQYTVSAARRSAHWGSTFAVTGAPVPGTVQLPLGPP